MKKAIGTSTLFEVDILSCFNPVVFGLSMLQQTRFVDGFNITQVTTIQYSVVLLFLVLDKVVLFDRLILALVAAVSQSIVNCFYVHS